MEKVFPGHVEGVEKKLMKHRKKRSTNRKCEVNAGSASTILCQSKCLIQLETREATADAEEMRIINQLWERIVRSKNRSQKNKTKASATFLFRKKEPPVVQKNLRCRN